MIQLALAENGEAPERHEEVSRIVEIFRKSDRTNQSLPRRTRNAEH